MWQCDITMTASLHQVNPVWWTMGVAESQWLGALCNPQNVNKHGIVSFLPLKNSQHSAKSVKFSFEQNILNVVLIELPVFNTLQVLIAEIPPGSAWKLDQTSSFQSLRHFRGHSCSKKVWKCEKASDIDTLLAKPIGNYRLVWQL